jgi:hypothetical protein
MVHKKIGDTSFRFVQRNGMNANNPLIQQKFSEANPSMYKAVRISEICPICKSKRATLMKIPAPALAVAALVQRGHNHLLAAFLSPSS